MELCRNHDLFSLTDDGDCRICRLESIAELLNNVRREIQHVINSDHHFAFADMQNVGLDSGLIKSGRAAIEDIKRAEHTFRVIRTSVSKLAKEELEAANR